MAKTNWTSSPGASDVAQYNRNTAFQAAGKFANQNYYDPNQEGSFELQSKLYSDPAAYANYVNNWVESWRANTTNVPNSNFKNELDYIQFLLRSSGLSKEKGGVSRGILTDKDLTGLKTASSIALANGVGFKDIMLSIYQSKQAAGEADDGPKYSKQIATSLRLLDYGDAQSKLSNAYFNMFGYYPTEENVKAFKKYWNTEARAQVAPVESSQVVQKGKVTAGKQTGMGTVSGSGTISRGEGFTAEEQQQTMANFLAKQWGVDPSKMELGGAVKSLYDAVRTIYRNNFLPEPAFESVASTIKDILSTPDETTYGTKLVNLQQSVRNQAAKFYPALATDLANGSDISATADIYYSLLARKWGSPSEAALKNDPEATSLVQKALNFRDEKGNVRIMDTQEFLSTAQKSNRYLQGEEMLAGVGRLGDKIIAAMGGGR